MKHYSIPDFSILLGKLKTVWGKELDTIKDCELFSEEILQITKERISPSTLFRWYVLNNQIHKPYRNTLDTLDKYLELKHPEILNQQATEQPIFPDASGLDFISLSLQHGEWKGLLAYLKKLPNTIEDIDGSIKFAGKIGKEIRNSARLQKGLIPELIKSEQGRLYVIEMFCDQDALEGYYHTALEKYIAVYPNKDQTKVLEDFLFASHLLVQSYILRKEFTQIKALDLEFQRFIPSIHSAFDKLHPMPKLRYYLLSILFSSLKAQIYPNLENESLLKIDQILIEHPSWKNVLLFEFSKTAAILKWNESLQYILSKLTEPCSEIFESTKYYVEYISEIIQKFSSLDLTLSKEQTDYKHIEYKRFNSQIVQIQATLNNLK